MNETKTKWLIAYGITGILASVFIIPNTSTWTWVFQFVIFPLCIFAGIYFKIKNIRSSENESEPGTKKAE
tara:strand:+ start:352 stop:561 length:210 start_codon:yes stop_codon:yes gene_type:complete